MRFLCSAGTFLCFAVLAVWPGAHLTSAQECLAPFSATTAGVTRLKRNPRLFVSGNFRGRDGTEQVRDLAYVSTLAIEGRDRQVLSVLLSSGNGCFDPPRPPDTQSGAVVVGEEPRLIVTGDFDGDALADLAIVDARMDPFNPNPTLRILLGKGGGQFKPVAGVDVVPLGEGETPIAMAIGRFRGGMPIDIAIVSTPATPSPASRGVLRILFNNGSGEFTVPSPAPVSLGDFVPAAMVASDNFRSTGKVDLVIKEAVPASGGRRRILYLQNAGNATFPSKDAVEGAGDQPALLVGALQSDDSGGALDDVITFERDMTIKIFVNDGHARFNVHALLNDHRKDFQFADAPQFFVADLGAGPLRLMAAAARRARPGVPGMLVLTSNEGGDFVDPPDFKEFRRIASPSGPPDQVTRTASLKALAPVPKTRSLRISAGIVSRFVNADHGNQKPDLALSARQVEFEVRPGSCPGGTQPLRTGRGAVVCLSPVPICEEGTRPVCKTPPSVTGRCECTCPGDGPTRPDPTRACTLTASFQPVLIVVGNPFDK